MRAIGISRGLPEDSPYLVAEDSPFRLPHSDPRRQEAELEMVTVTAPISGPVRALLAFDAPVHETERQVRRALRQVDGYDQPYWRWRLTESLATAIADTLVAYPGRTDPETFAFYAHTLADVRATDTHLVRRLVDRAGPALSSTQRAQIARDVLHAYQTLTQGRNAAVVLGNQSGLSAADHALAVQTMSAEWHEATEAAAYLQQLAHL